jgi:RNA polymerase sigma-70 factor (ECF subfamily)
MAAALKRTGDPHVAEEIMQEAFISLWKNRDKIEKPAVYLGSAVKYMCIAFFKKTGKYLHVPADAAINLPDDAPFAENLLDAKKLLQLLDQKADELPEQCRLVFHYSRRQQFTIQEIAEKMDLSPKTVKNHLTRALSILRKSLKSIPFFLFMR